MLKTLLVASWLMTGICAVPLIEKIVFPATMFSALRLASPFMVCFPVQYVPAAMLWSLVPGVMVAAALVVTVAVRLTDELPAVPAETYPALTEGVTDTLFDRVIVFDPVLTLADVPLMEAGAVADPEATLLDAAAP
jgi:hypothetical protein